MKKTLLTILTGYLAINSFNAFAQTATSLKIYDKAVFYDMYNTDLTLGPVPDGKIRLRNDLYTTKLSSDQIESLGDKITFKVTIDALCDNYDRIGNINLAFVPKGLESYTLPSKTDPGTEGVFRIEAGRYITPFMDKNKTPNSVPYSLVVDNLAKIFKDPIINTQYDIWLEFQETGVPYAANTQIAGCTGRKDVFAGTLEIISNTNTLTSSNNVLLPLNFQKNLNNYQAAATDSISTTVRTINFDLPNSVNSGYVWFIISNHGAGTNGEEYNRRKHYIYFDDALKLTYTPGELTCEPYRQYNTQPNGIYDSAPRTDATWQSFSNWCPGAKIPTRYLNIGNLAAGSHSFKISVPDAVFYNKDGNFPVSAYFQAVSDIPTTLGLNEVSAPIITYEIFPNPTTDFAKIYSSEPIQKLHVYNILGQQIWEGTESQIDLSKAQSGVYTCIIEFANNRKVAQKIIKN